MADDFLPNLVGGVARAKLLRVFVFDQSAPFTVRQASKRAGIPVRSAQREIRTFERWGLIKKAKMTIVLPDGKRVGGRQREEAWMFNAAFPHALALSKFVHEISPIDHKNILSELRRAGRLGAVIASGTFVGDPTRPADLIVIGNGLNDTRVDQAVRALEGKFAREIRYATFTSPEFRYRLTIQDRLVRDTLDYPHVVLLDKGGFF